MEKMFPEIQKLFWKTGRSQPKDSKQKRASNFASLITHFHHHTKMLFGFVNNGK